METKMIYTRLTATQHEEILAIAAQYGALNLSDFLRLKIAAKLNPATTFIFPARKQEMRLLNKKTSVDKRCGSGKHKNSMIAVEINEETYNGLCKYVEQNPMTVSSFLRDLVNTIIDNEYAMSG